jgi:IucA / IucC family/Ferric iron reductase FhuF-like transporter
VSRTDPVFGAGNASLYWTSQRMGGRVVEALLREDYGGLRRYVSRDGLWLRLAGLTIGLERADPGFLSDFTVPAGPTIEEALRVVRLVADARDDVAGFERECREALAATELHESVRPVARRSATYYDALAAGTDHPVHPASRCRLGLTQAELLAYAPEFQPVFAMRWAKVPRDRVTAVGVRPDWWPAPDGDHDLFPVHPLTAKQIETTPEPYLLVSPTLSMRTVAVDARTHLKVPLTVSTLGRRNRRTIAPGTLQDGALVQRVLSGLAGDEVLLADEQTYGHAGDPLLGYLVRRLPPGTAVPVAALLAPTPSGPYVISTITEDLESFFSEYLRILFAWNVALFGHGIALETHQQNLSVLAAPGGLKLLIKDHDAALLMGSYDVRDQRMLTDDPSALVRVFVTITLHLCAGALAFGLAERGLLPLRTGLGLVAGRLDEALGCDHPVLRAGTLDAETLPGKAMVTAGTLVDKARTGAADVNKHYGPPGPNYLRGR